MYKNVELNTTLNPYLLDHKFKGMCVAPGALLVSQVLSKTVSLGNIKFANMIPLAVNDLTSVSVSVDDTTVAFNSCDGSTVFATANIRANKIIPARSSSTADFHTTLAGTDIYRKLDSQGNNYGSAFQVIKNIAHGDGCASAEWQVPSSYDTQSQLTLILDSMSHVLGAVSDFDTAYYLDSIQNMDLVSDESLPHSLRLEMIQYSHTESSVTGSFLVMDSQDRVVLYVDSMCLAYTEQKTKLGSISLMGTFSLDPMDAVVEYWNEKHQVEVKQKYAPYGQIFQPLLQSNSGFDGSSETQVCLLRMEDWAYENKAESTSKSASSGIKLDGLDSIELPDGRLVAQLNPYETNYLYKEIFIDRTYKRHNVVVQNNDTVVDIGANIGLFSLFAFNEAKNVNIIAIEPSPAVLPILRANVAAYAPGTVVVAAGASQSRGEAEFTAYKKSSVFSSFSADEKDDKEAISTIIRNTLIASGHTDEKLVEDAVDEMMNNRLDFEKFNCPLVSVSDVIEEYALEQIGLLKIDAEKSEEEIIDGIKDEHWAIIQQIIIEVHKQSGSNVNRVLNILKDHGFQCVEDEEQLLSDSGLVTIYAVRPDRLKENYAKLPQTVVEESAEMFMNAAQTFVNSSNSNLDVVLCPTTARDPALVDVIVNLENKMLDDLRGVKNINVSKWSDFACLYPVEDIVDDVSNLQGHIPYTKPWYAATATTVYRKHLSRKRSPYKVLVLDCDNTIWSGVVGEVGSLGVGFESGHKYLHEFANRCKSNGMLLCLASKNNFESVKEVFDSRKEELSIKFDDVVAHRINWENKSENLISIAEELSLGLDSFIFIDDSPIECAEVRASCPEVLTIRIPESSEEFKQFLNHIWSFDRDGGVTQEDEQRSSMYIEEKKRTQLKRKAVSMKSFLDDLRLKVDIAPVTQTEIARASQMTQRTNQFNISTIRRSEQAIQEKMSDNWTCEYITVSDRFGDYGISGLVIYKQVNTSLIVDTLLLSCRILGRGIEYQLLAHLGNKALKESLELVCLPYKKSEKNEPVLKFMASIEQEDRTSISDEHTFQFQSEMLSNYQYEPGAFEEKQTANINSAIASKEFGVATTSSSLVEEIATDYNDPISIAKLVDKKENQERPDLDQVYVAPKTDTEKQIASVWCELLGFTSVGVEDNFFKLGGSSLKGVEMMAMLQIKLGAGLSVINLFENPSILHLSNVFDNIGSRSSAPTDKKKSRSQARIKARTRRAASAK